MLLFVMSRDHTRLNSRVPQTPPFAPCSPTLACRNPAVTIQSPGRLTMASLVLALTIRWSVTLVWYTHAQLFTNPHHLITMHFSSPCNMTLAAGLQDNTNQSRSGNSSISQSWITSLQFSNRNWKKPAQMLMTWRSWSWPCSRWQPKSMG